MIKHIVLEAGSYMGFSALGALKKLNENQYYKLEDIKTIYGTSAGAYVGILLCLNMKWDVLMDYIINRPWEKVVNINANMFLQLYTNKGLFDDTFFKRSLENVLLSKDLTLDVTLKEFYNFSKIELHMFSVNLQDFTEVEYSYKTHPNMKLLQAIYNSCAIPYIFKPALYNNKYYIDGGLLNAYPVKECINNGAKNEEILGIGFTSIKRKMESSTTLLELSYHIHKSLSHTIQKPKDIKLKHEIYIPSAPLKTFIDIIKDKDTRKHLIKQGREIADNYLKSCM